MAEELQQDGGGGLSRRDMIKASAIAGAAAWTAPVIIDSLSSPAAAASTGGSVACSKSLIFFRKSGDATTVYATGYQNSCVGCGCFGSFSSPNLSPGPPLYFTFSGLKFQVGVGTTNVQWDTTCGSFLNNVVAETSATCNTYLAVNSTTGVVSPLNGATILGAIGFEAGSTLGFVPVAGNLVFGPTCLVGGVAGLSSCA